MSVDEAALMAVCQNQEDKAKKRAARNAQRQQRKVSTHWILIKHSSLATSYRITV